jgi:hypothetical protein
MKRVLAGFAVGVMLATAGIGAAAATARQLRLRSSDRIHYAGIVCRAVQHASMICMPDRRPGYSVAISRRAIVVDDKDGKIVFSDVQP